MNLKHEVMTSKKLITVETIINSDTEQVWECWTHPDHITKWNFASEDWWCPRAQNDLRVGGKLTSRMEARDGSMGFDFTGTYTRIEPNKLLEYEIEDGRIVSVQFENRDNKTVLTETFEAENTHPIEMQKAGWQSILDNFKKHVESLD